MNVDSSNSTSPYLSYDRSQGLNPTNEEDQKYI